MSFFKHLDSFFIHLFTIRSALSPEYCKLKNILVESVLTDGVSFTFGLSFKAFLIIELRLSLQQIILSRTTEEDIHVFHFHSGKELILVHFMVNTHTIRADFNI